MNKVVVRFLDGRILKGNTSDFFPGKSVFHVNPVDAPAGSKPLEIQIKDLKAVFFVKDFSGKPQHRKRQEFDPGRSPVGRKIKVVFKDNEVMVGTTQGYQPDRPGFFMVPADSESNNERCYIFRASTQQIVFL
jgi:hypothetical protein